MSAPIPLSRKGIAMSLITRLRAHRCNTGHHRTTNKTRTSRGRWVGTCDHCGTDTTGSLT